MAVSSIPSAPTAFPRSDRSAWKAQRSWTALAVAIVAFALPVSSYGAGAKVTEATADQKEEAQTKYMLALEAFEQGDYAEALEGFRASYAVVASPNSRLMAARALVKLERPADAYNELTLTQREAEALKGADGAYEETATAARELQVELRPQVGLLTLEKGDIGELESLRVGEASVPVSELGRPLAVSPGEVVVVSRPQEGEPVTQRVSIPAGGQTTLRLRGLEEEPPYFRSTAPHPDYRLDLEPHLSLGLLDPPGPAKPGLGPGVRATLILLGDLLPPLNDSLGVGAGLDWVVVSSESHLWLPIVAQYNVWFSPKIAAFVEPGVSFLFNDETWVRPAVYGGGRFLFNDRLALTARVGYPNSSFGLSVLF